MKIVSWNVNGIRAAARKGFLEWLEKEDADIVCIQETKAKKEQLDESLTVHPKYHSFWSSASRPGYAGVAVFTKKKPDSFRNKFLGRECFHEDGRVIEMRYPGFTLLNIYFPNGGTRADGTEMLSYKLDFYEKLFSYLAKLKSQKQNIIICGDFNVAHTEKDIARPKENKDSIGFLPQERRKLDLLIEKGFCDVFRSKNPDVLDAYTWWSFRSWARDRNVGWRLDYFFVSQDLLGKVKKISHATEVMGSDHAPVVLEIDL